ncbi:MAG: GNAT family N-acetyltransferase [Alphaproteobacteria bacterium]|nr:GNAT family N-acetyltransferase [Alphaproteobacteria bacterium]
MVFSIFGGGKKKQPDPQPGGGEAGAGDDGKAVRPMHSSDIARVLEIINDHDEDDAEEARESFRESIDGMYVAVDNGRIVGVTGAVADEEADGIYWLSWTYVDERERRQGIGLYLVDGLVHHLQQNGARKMFISTGDYVEDGRDIYAEAKAFYRRLGAVEELSVADYYEPGEARHVYGLDLVPPDQYAKVDPVGDLVFDGLFGAPECDDGAALTWHEYQEGSEDDDQDGAEVLAGLIDEARREGARFIVAAIPSDLAEGASKGLVQAGFQNAGTLKDYYQPGVDQVHWVLRLNEQTV